MLYVRGVAENLARLVRAQAALAGQSMSDWVVEAVLQRLEREGVEIPEDGDES